MFRVLRILRIPGDFELEKQEIRWQNRWLFWKYVNNCGYLYRTEERNSRKFLVKFQVFRVMKWNPKTIPGFQESWEPWYYMHCIIGHQCSLRFLMVILELFNIREVLSILKKMSHLLHILNLHRITIFWYSDFDQGVINNRLLYEKLKAWFYIGYSFFITKSSVILVILINMYKGSFNNYVTLSW